jgi:hypothetical protein
MVFTSVDSCEHGISSYGVFAIPEIRKNSFLIIGTVAKGRN